MRIYISGKITGLPIEEAQAMFQTAEDFLHSKYKDFKPEVVNPFKIDHSKAREMESAPEGTYSQKEIWIQYMKEDLAALLNCTSVFMLQNWGQSQGARVEYATAKEMGFSIEYER